MREVEPVPAIPGLYLPVPGGFPFEGECRTTANLFAKVMKLDPSEVSVREVEYLTTPVRWVTMGRVGSVMRDAAVAWEGRAVFVWDNGGFDG
ncbi:hypothetical protein IHE55_28515 [Streptomyces pactum]|uniref:Uncharacterized protein n=1 Tax=Streptomyces pactum TaxID=68249 RepID=A0ABS0NTJ8_9ACTN|nr:hypothetical protein [Streptomyces pactum]MBH5338510.1 hypothetical protein [Streptomyces pactum]